MFFITTSTFSYNIKLSRAYVKTFAISHIQEDKNVRCITKKLELSLPFYNTKIQLETYRWKRGESR